MTLVSKTELPFIRMNFSDPYTFRARIQPALVVVLPLGFLMFALLPDHHFFVTAFFGLLGAAGGTAVVAQLGRDPGRKKERALWESWGGASTTRLLRHRHIPGDIELAPNLRQQIEIWWCNPLPDEEEEMEHPDEADALYERVTTALREATRDTGRFPLVFAELVNYGFRRNLWGLRMVGAPIAVALFLMSWALFAFTVWGRPWPDPWWDALVNPDSVAVIRLVVAVSHSAFAALWVFWVHPSWVRVIADAYALRLMESVQILGANTDPTQRENTDDSVPPSSR